MFSTKFGTSPSCKVLVLPIIKQIDHDSHSRLCAEEEVRMMRRSGSRLMVRKASVHEALLWVVVVVGFVTSSSAWFVLPCTSMVSCRATHTAAVQGRFCGVVNAQGRKVQGAPEVQGLRALRASASKSLEDQLMALQLPMKVLHVMHYHCS